MPTKKRYVKELISILVLVIIVGGLLVGAMLFGNSDWRLELFARSETVYIILILAIILPPIIIALIVGVHKRNKENSELPRYALELAESVIPRVEAERAAAAEAPFVTEEERAPRFYMLTETDARMRAETETGYDEEITLSDICERFRRFCAANMNLYYDISDIRRFISSLTVTHLIIMQGMSGTGKTSLAYAFGEFMQNQSVIVPIQPMWKERTDLIGYYNEFTKRFNETVLLQKMYEANYSKSMYVTVLDEMNIARVEYYFAEFLSLLEIPDPNKRYLDVVSDKWENDPILLRDGQIKLPMNMWFMGTVNNDDSTFAISDKVYDRAMVMNLDMKFEAFKAEKCEPIKLSAEYFERLATQAREDYAISNRNLRRIARLDEYLIETFRITFGNRIMKQIKGYVPVMIACGGNELDAIDDILSKKVLRKLEAQNPVYVKSMAESVCNYLDELFGQDSMPLCKEYLHRLERNA